MAWSSAFGSLEDVDGHSVDFRAEPGGRPAIVLFWATWCPYCRKLMPHLDSIQRDYRARGVEIYALNIWEDGDAVAYFAQHGYSMRLLLAADLVAEDYAVAWTPAVLLVDGAHDVLYARQRGETPEFVATAIREQLERALSDLE